MFVHESIKSAGRNSNVVYVEGLRCQGTHTGKPFTIAPGALPEVPPTGKLCQNDEERLCVEIEDGKIKAIRVYALGSTTGFIGLS